MRKMKVICLKTGAKFDSLKDAAAYAGVDKSAMSKHLKAKRLTAGGMVFMVYDPEWSPDEFRMMRKRWLNKLYGEAILIF